MSDINHLTLTNYQYLVQIDLVANDRVVKYPFRLNELGKYTHHQITLYQANYCHSDAPPTEEQPSVVGGNVDIVLF
jgi:hypothetical protein